MRKHVRSMVRRGRKRGRVDRCHLKSIVPGCPQDPMTESKLHFNTAKRDEAASPQSLAQRVDVFVRQHVIPYESDSRWGSHGPTEGLVAELRARARAAQLLTPHIRPDG